MLGTEMAQELRHGVPGLQLALAGSQVPQVNPAALLQH